MNITTHLQQDTKPCATINFETRKATFASNGDCNRTLTKKKEMDDRLPRNLWNLQYISCKLGVMSHTGAEHFGHDKACNPSQVENHQCFPWIWQLAIRHCFGQYLSQCSLCVETHRGVACSAAAKTALKACSLSP